MRKIAIVDNRRNFINDISTRILLNEDAYQFTVTEMTFNPSDIDKIIEKSEVDEICINEEIAYSRDNWNVVGPRITVYVSSMTAVNDMVKKGIPCYGVAKTAGLLLDLINANETTSTKKETFKDTEDTKDSNSINNTKEVHNVSKEKNQNSDDIDDFLFGSSSYYSTTPIKTISDEEKSSKDIAEQEKTSHNKENNVNIHENVEKNLFGDDYKEPVDAKKMQRKIEREEENIHDEYIHSDVSYRKRKRKASIITTYSAKGGVGKTTIACNLATYIAMSSNGRRKNRVCIIDYNFDFGDVLNHLSFDASGITMIDWAMDIRERLDNGESPDSIIYKKEEIESYLQKNKVTGLYALLAPVSHVDSLTIHSDELKIMINNILSYGDFDYVICDTGNNTRNSSMMSLERADHIIMIATQDVTTVHDNRSFLDAIKTFNNVDENRVLLVINKAKSKKETLISCKEVEDCLDIPCVAHLKETADVIKANNAGKPIVFDKNHEYTKGIGNIAARITGIGTYEPISSNVFSKTFNKVKDFFGF